MTFGQGHGDIFDGRDVQLWETNGVITAAETSIHDEALIYPRQTLPLTKTFSSTQIIPRRPSNPETRTESSDSLICKNAIAYERQLDGNRKGFPRTVCPLWFFSVKLPGF